MNKEKIERLVNKVKKAQSLMEEVNAEIKICNHVDYWHIRDEEVFKEVCEVLGLEYDVHYCGKIGHAKATYNGLDIICVFVG